MSESELIASTRTPATVASLCSEARALGVREGDTVMIHCALSRVGWVSGGAVAVVDAVIAAVGPTGTIVMPAHSAGVSDPANWGAPAVPPDWVPVIRESMPAYDPATTPTRDMGAVAEAFRSWPSCRRSAHPSASVAALGPQAAAIIARHDLGDPLGPTSPLGALYRLGAKVLLLGVDFDRCTALHLAEAMTWPDRVRRPDGAPVVIDGERRWVEFSVPQIMDDEEFLPVGAAARESGLTSSGAFGQAEATLVSLRALVDFAVDRWRRTEESGG